MSAPCRPISIIVVAALAGAVLSGAASGQQLADSTFTPDVPHPAYTTTHPVLLFDEGHANPLTLSGRFRPFAELLTADGYRVVRSPQRFSAGLLKPAQILMIVDPLDRIGDQVLPALSAFTSDEVRVIDNWVSEGGALLLVAEQSPFGHASAALAQVLRVRPSNGISTDAAHQDSLSGNNACLVFSRDNGLLGNHAITRGRDSSEVVRRVATWTGESFDGPPDAVSLLTLSKQAQDVPAADSAVVGGHAQGLAFTHGHGRVVVLGDAAMLTAQLNLTPDPNRALGVPLKMGINRTDLDNRQFTLNVVHWLSNLLDPRVIPPRPAGAAAHTKPAARKPVARATQPLRRSR